jgi:hypothetical protein
LVLISKMSGREPIILVQIDQDICTHVYAQSPCTATAGVPCYNTRRTCQDPQNYNRDVLTLNFVRPAANLAIGQNLLPFVQSINTAPTKLNPFTGNLNNSTLGERSVLNVVFQDAPHSDNLVDPYLSQRDFNPLERGTFWGKWLARNYYQNRPIRLYEGYVGQSLNEMQVRHYLIDAIELPGSNGTVKLTAKDPLKLVDKERAQIPIASTGRLALPMDVAQVSFTVERALIGDYDASGQVRIGSEIITYTTVTQSGTDLIFSGCVRGTFGSTASTHDANDAVQKTIVYQDKVLWEGVKEFLIDWAGIDPAYIDDTEWQDEYNQFLAQFNFTSVLSKPQSVFAVLNQLTQQLPFFIYWDERANKIQFKASRYYAGDFPVLTESDIVADSFSTTTNPRDRISQVWVYHTPRDWTKDDLENFKRLEITANLEVESRDLYDEQKIRIIQSRWISAAQAVNLTDRLIRSNFDSPLYVKFSLDAKEPYWVADVVDIEHRGVVDFFGNKQVDRFLIYSAKERISGEIIDYEAVRVVALSVIVGRYTVENAPLYEDATELEKETGAWYSDAQGQLPVNVDGYEYE